MTASCGTPSTPTETQAGPATSAPTWAKCCHQSAIRRRVRQLFQPAPGYTLVGADLSGSRCVRLVSSSDRRRRLRQGRSKATSTRQTPTWSGSTGPAKTMIYALCFGAGDTRLGQILGSGPQAEGHCGNASTRQTPPRDFGPAGEEHSKEQGYLLGLDKRQLPIRSDHAALNVLLQSAGALLSKKWVELIDAELTKQNPTPGSSHGSTTRCRSKRRRPRACRSNHSKNGGRSWQSVQLRSPHRSRLQRRNKSAGTH